MSVHKSSIEVIVNNPGGLHARPASNLAEIAQRFRSKIVISKKNPEEEKVEANAISPIELLLLVALEGTILVIVAEGEDAEMACQAIKEFIETQK
jgi:phosphotransferase system HPr (HPr) family protein